MKEPRKAVFPVATLLALAVLFAAAPGEAAKPPTGRTYFIVSLGVAMDGSEAYEIDAGCLRFTQDVLCESEAGGDCGIWWRIDEETRSPRQWAAGFEFFLTEDETGLPIHILGRGRIDARGPKSSLAAVATGVEETSGATINFAIAGRAVGAQRCTRLVAEFEAAREEAQGD